MVCKTRRVAVESYHVLVKGMPGSHHILPKSDIPGIEPKKPFIFNKNFYLTLMDTQIENNQPMGFRI